MKTYKYFSHFYEWKNKVNFEKNRFLKQSKFFRCFKNDQLYLKRKKNKYVSQVHVHSFSKRIKLKKKINERKKKKKNIQIANTLNYF